MVPLVQNERSNEKKATHDYTDKLSQFANDSAANKNLNTLAEGKYFKASKTNESIKLIGQVIENSERISSSLLWGSGKQMRGGH